MTHANRTGALIAAVFLAFGGGVIVGNTILPSNTSSSSSASAVSSDTETGPSDDVVAPEVPGDTLADARVAIVVLPGAEDGVVSEVTGAVTQAGGSITGTITVASEALSSDGATRLNDLATGSLPPGLQLPTGATATQPGAVAGSLIGTAWGISGRTGEPTATDDNRALVTQTFDQSGLISGLGDLAPMSLAVVVAGAGDGAPGGVDAVTGAALAAGLDAGGVGTVIAGPEGSADVDSVVTAARSRGAEGVSTVDDVTTDVGRATLVLALREQRGGQRGHYGTGAGALGRTVQPR